LANPPIDSDNAVIAAPDSNFFDNMKHPLVATLAQCGVASRGRLLTGNPNKPATVC
jgi:hypothetical protein